MAEESERISIRSPSAPRNFNKPIRIMDRRPRTCVFSSVWPAASKVQRIVRIPIRLVFPAKGDLGLARRGGESARGTPSGPLFLTWVRTGLRKHVCTLRSLRVLFIGSGKLFRKPSPKFEAAAGAEGRKILWVV